MDRATDVVVPPLRSCCRPYPPSRRALPPPTGPGALALLGPYLSERQWGTVREDYSPYGNAWDYFPHDHARSRAYRWGEDGSPASPTTSSGYAWGLPCGTAGTRS